MSDYIWSGLATFAINLVSGAVPQNNTAISVMALPVINGLKDYLFGRYNYYGQRATADELRLGIVELKTRMDFLERLLSGLPFVPNDSNLNLDPLDDETKTRLESLALGSGLKLLIKSNNPLDIVKLAVAESKINNIDLAQQEDRQKSNVYLYLASNNYAGAIDTLNIAIHHNFLWRSYFAKKNKKTKVYQSIAHVRNLKEGDVLVLAYREEAQFRILSPLVVTSPLDEKDKLKTSFNDNDITGDAFTKLNNSNLIKMLVEDGGYGKDPKLNCITGLPVKLLDANFESEQARIVYNSYWPSPRGNNTIWLQNDFSNIKYGSLMAWMDTLKKAK